jgi:hypothetical protein
MAQLPVTQRRLQLPSSFQETQFSDAGVKSLQRTSDMLLKQTQAIEERASNNAYLKAQGAISKELNRLETEYGADPENLEQAITNFSDKFMENIYDPDVRGKIELQLQEKSLSAIGRATDKRNKIITDQGVYDTLLAVDGLSTEMEKVAVDAFSSNPTLRAAAGKQMQEIMLRGQTILDQKGPDGMPLLSPEKRVSTLFAIRDGSFESIAKAYIQSSPNKLAAADDWINGRVSIELPNPDGTMQKINMRDAMPASAHTKADNVIMDSWRNQVAMENHVEQKIEKRNKELADRAVTEINERLMEDPNSVTLEELEINKNLFIKGDRGKDYLALKKTIISGEPEVEDGAIVTQLNVMAAQGQDVSSVALNAMANGKIKRETYWNLKGHYERSVNPNPIISTWTRRLKESYGSQLDMKPALAATMVNAEVRLHAKYREFKQKNGRDPDDSEMETIYRNVSSQFKIIEDGAGISGSKENVPSWVPDWIVTAPRTQENLEKALAFTESYLTKKFGPDRSKWGGEKVVGSKFIQSFQNEVNSALTKETNKKSGSGV